MRILHPFVAVMFLLITVARVDGQGLRAPAAEVASLTAADGVHAGDTAQLAIQVSLPEGMHVNANTPRDPSLIPVVLTVDAPPGTSVLDIAYPVPTDLEQLGAEQPLAVYGRTFAIGVRLAIGRDLGPGELTIPARLRYQACNDKMCFVPGTVTMDWTLRIVAPEAAVSPQHQDLFAGIPFGSGVAPPIDEGTAAPTAAADSGDGLDQLDDFAVLASTGGYLGTGPFLQFIHDAEAGIQERGLLEGRGILAILVLVLVGGLALNLTPCVLPMIPINLAIIGAGVQAGSRRRGFLLGSAYGAAMALVYGILGLVVILTAGTFGTINASPWFNAAMAALFVVLGLAMFDVLTIDFSRLSGSFGPGSQSRRGSFLLAFVMGGVAALLAGACVAPVVIQVVLFSTNMYAGGATAALALPFVLGLGMALPWPVAGAGISALPKPGPWMVRVKQVFGVFILGTSLYFGYLAYTLFADRWVDRDEVAASVQQLLKEGDWHASLAEGLALARREQKPVLIDMWATWCKNCLTMDKTTLSDPEVTEALSGYVKIKFQAESPDQPPVDAVMQRFGAIGLPTYVILKPKS